MHYVGTGTIAHMAVTSVILTTCNGSQSFPANLGGGYDIRHIAAASVMRVFGDEIALFG